MTTYETDQAIVNDVLIEQGDDIYGKPIPTVGLPPADPADWLGDNKTAFPDADGSTVYEMAKELLDTTETVIIYKNQYSKTFTVDYGSDQNAILASDVLSTDLSTLVYFKGNDTPSGLTAGKSYWAINIVEGVSFEVEAVKDSGVPVDLGDDGSGYMTYTMSSRRSYLDEKVYMLDSDESSLIAEGQSARNEANTQLLLDYWLALVLTRTTINALDGGSSQTTFTIIDGAPNDDAYNNRIAVIIDASTALQKGVVGISDYIGSSKTVILNEAPVFTIAPGDKIRIFPFPASASDLTDILILLRQQRNSRTK